MPLPLFAIYIMEIILERYSEFFSFLVFWLFSAFDEPLLPYLSGGLSWNGASGFPFFLFSDHFQNSMIPFTIFF